MYDSIIYINIIILVTVNIKLSLNYVSGNKVTKVSSRVVPSVVLISQFI